METYIKNTALTSAGKTNIPTHILLQEGPYDLEELMTQLATASCKKSFLVFKQNKYFTVPVESIAFFYVKYDCSTIVCMDQREYPVNYSLDQIQHLLAGKQFFRINRQYLINFNAVKEAEHYFARKLLVTLIINTAEKLLVPKEKARLFLDWLEDR
jgi:two-component system, LytTR family, response regulator LytT